MTSANNHAETVDFFTDNNFFGANPKQITFFQQTMLPAMDTEGKIIMKSATEIALGPNGNGAVFESINSNPLVKAQIKASKYVQVIGVDNVMNRVLDPLHIGFTASKGFEASLKCCKKAEPCEKVGTICVKNGKYDIVEYSEMTEEQNNKRLEDGRLYFELGNILIFVFNSKKLIALSEDSKTLN